MLSLFIQKIFMSLWLLLFFFTYVHAQTCARRAEVMSARTEAAESPAMRATDLLVHP